MASSGKQILGPNTTISVNGSDLTKFANSITLNDAAADVDVTGFGENYTEHLNGIRDSSIDVTFFQSYGSGEVDAVIGALYYANTSGTVKINPDTNGTVVYTQVSKIQSFSPVSGGVGAANETSVTFVNGGTAGLTRGTS